MIEAKVISNVSVILERERESINSLDTNLVNTYAVNNLITLKTIHFDEIVQDQISDYYKEHPEEHPVLDKQ